MRLKAMRTKPPIFLILIVGLVLRLISINQSLWLDEATSGWLARDFSFADIIAKFSPGDFHPPLYYLILKAWGLIFGYSEIALRSFSLLAGLLTIYVVYLIAKELFNQKVALIASLLLATSGLHIYFSQEVRMYVLASLLVSLTVYCFVKILKQSRVGYWLGLALFLACSVMTHYLTLLLIPVYWLVGVINKKNLSWWRKFIASHIILVFSWLIWWPVFKSQLSTGTGVEKQSPVWWRILGQSNLKEALLVPVKFMIGRVSFENKTVYMAIVILTGLVFGYLLLRSARFIRTVKNSYISWLWLIVPGVLTFVISYKLAVFSYFRLLFVLPAFYLLVALGLSSLKRYFCAVFLALVITLNLIFSGIYLFNPKYHRENWRGLIEYLRPQVRDNPSLVVIFVTYGQREAFHYYDRTGEIRVNGPALIEDGYSTIWLMRYAQPIFDPEDKVRSRIEALGYTKTEERDFNGVAAWKYQQEAKLVK